jgi:hypothetical protein
MGMPEIKHGTFTSASSAADVDINLGFVPDHFELIVGADTNPNIYIYDKNLGDASTIKMTGSTGAYTYETSNPIVSKDAGSISTATVMGETATKDIGFKGVTIPAELQVNSKVNYWTAIRQGA